MTDELQQAIGNLLARIHRDGGQHQLAVGTVQACKDAEEVWLNVQTEISRLPPLRKALAEAASELGEVAGPVVNRIRVYRKQYNQAIGYLQKESEALREALLALHPESCGKDDCKARKVLSQ